VTKLLAKFPLSHENTSLLKRCSFAIMPLRTSLGLRNANTRIQKKNKTFRIKLSSHKCSIIKGLYKASCPIKDISEIENTAPSTVRNTIKNLNIRSKKHSLPHSGCSSILSKVDKHSIIRFHHENLKATYIKVKQKL
jgi:DNA-binding CsgD family transcriptional regulator